MNFKIKKYILGSAALLTSAVPLVAISCKDEATNSSSSRGTITSGADDLEGRVSSTTLDGYINSITEAERVANAADRTNPTSAKKPFDQMEKSTLVLGVTFSETNNQYKSLQKLIEVYNKLVKEKSSDIPGVEAAKPFEIKNIGSGYNGGAQAVVRSLENTDANSFINLTFNYAALAASLAEYNMLLSFNDEDKQANYDISHFSNAFVAENYTTQYFDAPTTNILPAFKSTNVLAVNGSVLAYVLKTLEDNGVKFAADTETTDFVSKVKAAGAGDATGVQKEWGNPVPNIGEVVKGFEFSKNVFKTWKGLLAFSELIQKMFVNSVDSAKAVQAFGVDSPVALFESALFASLGADYQKMIQSVNVLEGNKIQVSYRPIHNENSEAYAKGRIIYDAISKSVTQRVLKLQPPGAFSSGDQIQHKFAYSIGSTAGYSHNFTRSESISSFEVPNKPYMNFDLNRSWFTWGVIPKKLSGQKPENVLAYVDNFSNPIFKSSYTNDLNRFEYKALDEESDKKIAAAWQPENKNEYIIKVPYSTLDVNKSSYTELKASANYIGAITSDSGQNFVLIKATKTQGKSNEEILNAALEPFGYQLVKRDSTGTLQESELFILPSPSKWEESDPKDVIFSQGPSVIGIHANEKDDKATRMFVKWFMTADKTYSELNNKKPVIFLQEAMSYVTPVTGFETAPSPFRENNQSLKTALELYKKVATDPNWVAYNEPGTTQANPFRDQINSSFTSLQNAANSGSQYTYRDFIDKIQVGKNRG
ncbi:P68 family surface lipoprotein [Mycoplasma corogypsi]|uniref:P68 family surface lipoprotein n=1 Tax=Mycoplasma corogypsi TaxID=2106 RepID=UPI0038736640